jgi:hypothetical protein
VEARDDLAPLVVVRRNAEPSRVRFVVDAEERAARALGRDQLVEERRVDAFGEGDAQRVRVACDGGGARKELPRASVLVGQLRR